MTSIRALPLALILAACTAGPGAGGAQAGLGRQVAAGQAKRLVASADGTWLAWLDGCTEVRGRFLPPGTASCDLRVVPAAGGAAALLARGVTSLPQGLVAAPEGGQLAALADYDAEAGTGTLLLVADGKAREVAKGVTFHGFAPGGGVLLAVAGGRLLVVPPEGPARAIPGAEGVATFDAAPAPWAGRAVAVLARRPVAAGGGLLAIGPGLGGALPVAEATREFALAPARDAWAFTTVGKAGAELHLRRGAQAQRLGGGARTFAFSPDGAALAWVSDAAPGRQGDLHAAGSGGDAVLGKDVGEHRWAAAAPRLAWLESYDPRTRSGVLGSGGPGLSTRTFGRAVSDFELSPDGRHLAFLRHTTEGGYSVDLELTGSDAPAGQPSRKVARGVFGFAFSPDGAWLYYRTRCTRQAEACDLERVSVAGAGAAAQQLAQGVKSFEFDPRDPERLLVTWQRMDLVALDLAVWRNGTLTAVDQGALPGSIRFLGPDSGRLAYAVVQPKRAGVYVATPP